MSDPFMERADCMSDTLLAEARSEINRLSLINAALVAALLVAQKLAASGPAPLPPSDPRWAQIADAIARAKP